MDLPSDPISQFLADLAAYDAACDEWEKGRSEEEMVPFDGGFVNKFLSKGNANLSKQQIEKATIGNPRWFSQKQIIKACRNHSDLEVVQGKKFALVGTSDLSESLITPSSKLKQKELRLFLSEMWGQWFQVPQQGWDIKWEADVVSDTEISLHPYIPKLFKLMERDPSEDAYILHETITEALGLELLIIPR